MNQMNKWITNDDKLSDHKSLLFIESQLYDKHYFKCLIYGPSLNSHNNLIGNDNCGDKTILSINEMFKGSDSRIASLSLWF